MKKKDLLFSLGELDDSVIADAKPRDRKKIITRGLTVAACLVLAVGITFGSIALSFLQIRNILVIFLEVEDSTHSTLKLFLKEMDYTI